MGMFVFVCVRTLANCTIPLSGVNVIEAIYFIVIIYSSSLFQKGHTYVVRSYSYSFYLS